jgi:uncharacterized RDD family membrane protein YckC
VSGPDGAPGEASSNADPPAHSSARPASLPLRIAAMVYEGVLIFGIAFVAALLLLFTTGWTAPLDHWQRLMMQATVFVALGIYFCWCWIRSGQTLALKTWNLRIIDAAGLNPTLPRAIARYVLSWTLFVPGLVYIALLQPSRAGGLAALAIGFVLTLAPALFDRDRRLLHDRWSRTRIVRTR